MDWSQVLFLFFANSGLTIPLILWMRSESRNDWRHCDAHIKAIHEEMKDFHGRLCAIEERNKKK